MTDNTSAWTTLSATHVDKSQRADNPLYESAGQTHRNFEAQSDPMKVQERDAMQLTEAQRRRSVEASMTRDAFMTSRGSSMVTRDRIQPVLRPSPRLAYGVDATSFDAKWEAERRAAQHAMGLNKQNMDRAAFLASRASTQKPSKEFDRQRDDLVRNKER